MEKIDCRNMACPIPVVTTKRALEEASGKSIEILVDDGAPRENVTRFALNRGYKVDEKVVAGGISLLITPGSAMPSVSSKEIDRGGATVMMITTDKLGDGPEELGWLLMKNLIITLLDLEQLPDRMLFLNTGVHLTTEGSEVLEALEKLGNRGVEVMSCGVCLDYFNKKEKLRAGIVTNMFTTAESLMKAGSVIKI